MVRFKAGWRRVVGRAEWMSQWSTKWLTYAVVVAVMSILSFIAFVLTPYFVFVPYTNGWIWSALSAFSFGVGAASFVVSVSISARQSEEAEARESDRDTLLKKIQESAASAAINARAAKVASERAAAEIVDSLDQAAQFRGIAARSSRLRLEMMAERAFLNGAGVNIDLVPRILWVDDNPDNNHYERRALQEAGIVVDVSYSTSEALARISDVRFDLVISDMERDGNRRAGYELLQSMRDRGHEEPFVVYAGDSRPEFLQETLALGGNANTSDPYQLIDVVTRFVVARSQV